MAAQPAPAPCCAAAAAGGGTYASPAEAFRSGARERLLYVPCIVPDASRPDYLATVDCDPASPTHAQVVHRLPLGAGDELHHSGWNACASCHGDASARC